MPFESQNEYDDFFWSSLEELIKIRRNLAKIVKKVLHRVRVTLAECENEMHVSRFRKLDEISKVTCNVKIKDRLNRSQMSRIIYKAAAGIALNSI